jgi:hypothetical protein
VGAPLVFCNENLLKSPRPGRPRFRSVLPEPRVLCTSLFAWSRPVGRSFRLMRAGGRWAACIAASARQLPGCHRRTRGGARARVTSVPCRDAPFRRGSQNPRKRKRRTHSHTVCVFYVCRGTNRRPSSSVRWLPRPAPGRRARKNHEEPRPGGERARKNHEEPGGNDAIPSPPGLPVGAHRARVQCRTSRPPPAGIRTYLVPLMCPGQLLH